MHSSNWFVRGSVLLLLGAGLAANPGKLLTVQSATACTYAPVLEAPVIAAGRFIVLPGWTSKPIVKDSDGKVLPSKSTTVGPTNVRDFNSIRRYQPPAWTVVELSTAPAEGAALTIEDGSSRSESVTTTALPTVDSTTLKLTTTRAWVGKTCGTSSQHCGDLQTWEYASAESVATLLTVDGNAAIGLLPIYNQAYFEEAATEYCIDARFWDTFSAKEITVRRCVKDDTLATPEKPTSFCTPDGAAGAAGAAGSPAGGAPANGNAGSTGEPTLPGTGGEAPEGSGGANPTSVSPRPPESTDEGGCSLGVTAPTGTVGTLLVLVAGWWGRRRRSPRRP